MNVLYDIDDEEVVAVTKKDDLKDAVTAYLKAGGFWGDDYRAGEDGEEGMSAEEFVNDEELLEESFKLFMYVTEV